MSGYSSFARFYDILTQDVDYPGRAAYFDFMIRRSGGRPMGILLDLACGTGSLSVEFASLGYEVIGVDASAEMLSIAMQKEYEAQNRVLFLQQRMEELDLFGTVGITVCALDSINHLPDEAAVAAVFGKVALFTEPGGLFLFDVNTYYKHRIVLGNNTFLYEPEGVFCVWRNSYHTRDNRVDMRLDFWEEMENGLYRRSWEEFSERTFSERLLEDLLEKNNFTLLEILGDDGFDPPTAETQRLVYVARKNAP